MAAKKPESPSTETEPNGTEPSMPFETRMEQLESVVDELESGSLSLDEAFAKYQQGVELLRGCSKTLEAMERRIEILEKEGAVPRPFEGAAGDDDDG